MSNDTSQLEQLIGAANSIVIIQADNPDADSLGSALALEQIFGEAGKRIHLYCGVDMPGYLQHIPGYDRVSSSLPKQFDLSVIVDTSASSLLQKLADSGEQGWVASRPNIVLDHHHTTENDIPFATLVINDPAVSSTGELVYNLAKQHNWPLDVTSGEYIMQAILGDTQGLTNGLATSSTYRIMAELMDMGVNRPKLEDARREYAKMDPTIFKYKADLIARAELAADGRIAVVTVPQNEISQYSPLYNPAPLIQSDMLMTRGVAVALVLKYYNDGKILGSIRCNSGYGVGAELAQAFGGGGHEYASGFKIQDGRPLNQVKSECLQKATELLDNLNKEPEHETAQHANA
jgi:bifunctional oligoribonuclease and PAP phosphatase NrnA